MGILLMAALMVASANPSTSVFPSPIDDPRAVVVQGQGDGVADDTAAIQKAIDAVPGEGIVFVPSGKYRLTDTICVWPGVRVIGYGPTRPVFYVAPNTAGFGTTERNMVFFAGRKPRGGQKPNLTPPKGGRIDYWLEADSNPGTFYSAMSNVDLEVAPGNPMAVGVRSKYAQHCFLAHMDFRMGDGFAGIHEAGNSAHHLRFFGGRYGIVSSTPSPGWPFTLLDSEFVGQKEAAIRALTIGLTLIRPTFRGVPTAVQVEPNRTEQLWMSDARLEDISGPALVISREKSLRTQITLQNATCRNVSTFAKFRESGSVLAGKGTTYEVSSLRHGLAYGDLDDDGAVRTDYVAQKVSELSTPTLTDIRALPKPSEWVNVKSLGATGDGATDDTAALQNAINLHPVLYLPMGKYRVTQPLVLRQDSVLIGLHPFCTQIVIKDRTQAFSGQDGFPGEPVPLLEAPKGGHCVVTGVGLDTGGNNPGAVALRWKAGADSMVDDVKFLGGHGSVPWQTIYNANHSGDPDPSRKWDSQYSSLWVTDGGGGTFLNLWTASSFAHSGMEVSDTATEGRVYEVSSEHHVRHEIQLRNASNWSFYGLQTEEERGEGPFAVPIEIENCSNILVANLNIYRVISMEQPMPYAVKVAKSRDIRFRNIHCNSNSKASFDSLILDSTRGLELRQREFNSVDLDCSRPVVARHEAKVVKLAGGFHNISGGAVDAKGNFTFIDAKFHKIYHWDGGLSTLCDAPLSPVNAFYDDSGDLVVVSYAGKGVVYSIRPGQDRMQVLKPEPSAPRPGKWFALPVTDFEVPQELVLGQRLVWSHQIASPDGSTYLPTVEGFLAGDTDWGVKSQAIIRSFGLVRAKAGQTVYWSGENQSRTYSAVVGEDGSLSGGKLFAEQGGEAVAVGPDGNVYLGAGQVFVYSPGGKLLRAIHVPERPIQLAFGGADGKTLFICARTSLYSVRG